MQAMAHVSDSSRGRVLVAGATGYLGRHVLEALHTHGYPTRALVRDPERLGDVRDQCDEVFVGQATENKTLDGLCDGVEIVFSSIGLRSLAPRPTFWEVDYQANMNIVIRAMECDVRQFIFVSVLHAESLRSLISVAEARERVVDALVGSGLTWTVFRPTGSFNDMEGLFKMARRGVFYVIGDGGSRINPIHGKDLASEVTRSIQDERFHNQALELGGPDTFTFRQIGELAFDILKREPKIRSIPSWLLTAGSLLLRPFNTNAATLLRAIQITVEMDMTGRPCGSHRLRDFFQELTASS
jgi:uncharacterized protein YbjT (DUF2867 family)